MKQISRSGIIGLVAALAVGAGILVAPAAPAQLATDAPWNGEPISVGLGPTYGEQWCEEAAPGSSIAGLQGSPLALIPSEAIGCTLEKIQAEADTAGIPKRMEHFVIGQSATGRPIHAAVVNALETEDQQRDYERWQQIREIELEDPAAALELLEGFGPDVKMPIFVQANIHGNEREGADAMMQVLRDLVTLPRGTSDIVDKLLDESILIVIPSLNPDGRFAGSRANGNGLDMNRDWLVQSQREVRASARLQHEWLATAGLDLHGYVNPTLIDGLTKPHNPGIDYDRFLFWNQRRLDANEQDLLGIGMLVSRPANDYNMLGTMPGHPHIAEGWDDWGPFYTQTYMALYGVDSSTVEMCSSQASGNCNGRLGSKNAQYLTFYSSADFWLDNKTDMMWEQIDTFKRGVDGSPRPPCCSDPFIAAAGFTEDQHNWMVEFPTAYVIPRGAGQRSDAEANRMAEWLLDNSIEVERATEDFTYNGRNYEAGSYIVWMNQALRGLALTTLSAGQDISDRITQLYSPPAAWSHGLLWGADTIEVPTGDGLTVASTPIDAVDPLTGGIVGGIDAPADWYALTLRGPSEHKAFVELLRRGSAAKIAEDSFATTTEGLMPAGSILFPASAGPALDAFGAETGIDIHRAVGVDQPPTTLVERAPRVAVLASNTNRTDTLNVLQSIYGDDAAPITVNALQNEPADPLADFDVIYNAGVGWPSATNTVAQERLRSFFQRGGGYIATSVSTNGFTFLTGAGLVEGTLSQGSQSASGGIAVWHNIDGAASPTTGVYPDEDYLYLPSSVTYFSSVPVGAVVEGQYHYEMANASPNGPSPGFVAGLWRSRLSTVNSAPVIVRGETAAETRYLALATNPFSRQDAERAWTLISQAILWTNLTDDPRSVVAGKRWTVPVGLNLRYAPPPPDVEELRAMAKPGTRAAD